MQRDTMTRRLHERDQPWDIAIIGGGATGVGIAIDAASRGYDVVLLEQSDFGKGTSSRSTKLIHGGVRYLARGQVGLVREALLERGLLLRNAPHLVHRRAFLVPAYRLTTVPYYGIGLKLYDLLAGRRRLGWSRMLGASTALDLAPTLRREGLRGGALYEDGQFDDARLAIALARSIDDAGGVALNYVAVNGILKDAGRVVGVVAEDAESRERFEVRGRAVINATGVFTDAVRRLDEPAAPALVRPSRGTHLVLPRSFLPGETAVLVPRTEDGRVLFAIPWHDRVLLGTTDTPARAVDVEPRADEEDIDYLLRHAARYLEPAPTRDDVRSVFAGLRPLIDEGHTTTNTARLSREHVVQVSHAGLVTITGGKWTTYRRMAADAVDRAIAVAGLTPRPSTTERLRLHGWSENGRPGPLGPYGADAANVQRVLAERPEWDAPLHPDLPYRVGEVIFAARHEAARTVADVLARRTRALFLDAQASRAAAPRVAALLAEALGHESSWQAEQARQFDHLCRAYSMA